MDEKCTMVQISMPVFLKAQEYVLAAQSALKAAEDAAIKLIWAKWSLGKHLVMCEPQYGEQFIAGMAHSLSHDPENPVTVTPEELWRCMKFARRFPEDRQVQELIDRSLSWTKIKREMLYDKREVADNVMNIGEWSTTKLRSAVEEGIPEEKRDEVVSMLKERIVEEVSIMRDLDERAVIELPNVKVELSKHPDQWTQAQTNAYQVFSRVQGCALCGRSQYNGDVIDFHHYPRTRGAGGENWQGIPLCREHHVRYQNMPDVLLATDGYALIRWLIKQNGKLWWELFERMMK